MLISKEITIATCSEAPPSRVGLQDTITRKQSITSEGNVNATRIYKTLKSKAQILEMRHKSKTGGRKWSGKTPDRNSVAQRESRLKEEKCHQYDAEI